MIALCIILSVVTAGSLLWAWTAEDRARNAREDARAAQVDSAQAQHAAALLSVALDEEKKLHAALLARRSKARSRKALPADPLNVASGSLPIADEPFDYDDKKVATVPERRQDRVTEGDRNA